MDTIELLGVAMGLGLVAGVRLYATVFALGVGMQLGLIHPTAHEAGFEALQSWTVILASGAALLVEFFADKIPWVDSLWDGFHSFIRPIGAAVLAAKGFTSVDPALELTLVVLCGGVAFASHASKAATRFGINHSPEPFSNLAASLLEDGLVPFGVWLSLEHPGWMLLLVALFLAAFAWVAPKILRLTRLQFVALSAWLGGKSAVRQERAQRLQLNRPIKPEVAEAIRIIAVHSGPLPESHLSALVNSMGGNTTPCGIRAGAARNIKGLGHSVGYLAVGDQTLAFAARRGFRLKAYSVRLSDITDIEWRRGLLVNKLTLGTATGRKTFFVFKDVDIKIKVDAAPLSAELVKPALPRSRSMELYCRKGLMEGSRFPVPSEGFYIGRSPSSAHLIVDSPKVSARHVRVTPDAKSAGLWIEDLDSTNGTYLGDGSAALQGRQFLPPGSRFALSQGIIEFEVRSK